MFRVCFVSIVVDCCLVFCLILFADVLAGVVCILGLTRICCFAGDRFVGFVVDLLVYGMCGYYIARVMVLVVITLFPFVLG